MAEVGAGPSTSSVTLSVPLAAYLVHLIWRDVERGWSARRQLTPEDVMTLAEQIAASLPPETRSKLRPPAETTAAEPEAGSRAA